MTDPRLDILSIGNAIVDVLGHVDEGFLSSHGQEKGLMRIVGEDAAPGLHSLLDSPLVTPGGSTANTAVGAALLGRSTGFIGKVRDDATGEVFREGLAEAGVAYGIPGATVGPATARCIVLVTPDGERTMDTFIGACTSLGPDDVDDRTVASASYLMLEGYLWDVPSCRDACIKAIQIALQAGRKVALTLSDPGCAERNRRDFTDLVSQGVIDVLFANRKEILSLYDTGEESVAMHRLGAAPVLGVVTRSADGVAVTSEGAITNRPAHPVTDLVDTTGAGDMFAAGFLTGRCAGLDIAASADLAAFCSSQVIARMGARPPSDIAGLASRAGLLP